MKKSIQYLTVIVTVILLASCKSTKQVAKVDITNYQYLSSKVELTIPHGEAIYTVNGTMKMKEGELVQMSFLMPIFRSEVARIEATPNYLLMIDRMNRRYVKATPNDLRDYLHPDSYQQLEKLIKQASQPNGKATLSGEELGIRRLAKAKIELYDFSTDPINVEPSVVSSRYKLVTMEELLQFLMSL